MISFVKRLTSVTLLFAVVASIAMVATSDAHAAGGKPGKPTQLTATADDHDTVNLSWNAPTSGASPSGYRIFRRDMDDSGSSMSRIATSSTTSYTDNSVSSSTSYRYKVSAVTNRKQGPRSNKADVTTADTPGAAPDRPAGLDLSEDTAGEVVATWTAPSSGATPTGYKLYRTDIAESTTTLLTTTGTTTLSYTDDTVEEETWYSYSVKAINDNGEGPANGPDSIKSKNQTPGVPEEITSLEASEETVGQVVVSWTAATDGPTPTGFKVYRKRLSTGGDYGEGDVHIATTGAGASSYTDSSVAAGVSYEYSVRAKNEAGHSGAWRRAFIETQ